MKKSSQLNQTTSSFKVSKTTKRKRSEMFHQEAEIIDFYQTFQNFVNQTHNFCKNIQAIAVFKL